MLFRTRNSPSVSFYWTLIFGVILFAGSIPFTSAQGQASSTGAAGDTMQIGFDEAIRTALDQNTDIKRAQSDLRQSETEVRAEWMDFVPDFNVSTGVTRRFGRNFSQIDGEIITQSTDFLSMSGRSSITLFNGFENSASLQQASRHAEASDLSFQRTRREVVFTVMEQYISLVESREIVRVRQEEVEARRQQLRQIEEFVDAGSRPVSDLYQEQANAAEAEQQLLQAEREREVNKTRIIQTLQLNPRGQYYFEVPDLGTDSLGVKGYELSALIDEAFQNRLDLRAAKAERQAAGKGIRSARSSYYPNISVSGSYGTDWTSRARPIPDPETGQPIDPSFSRQLDNNRSGSISLSLDIPIFDQFQRETRIQQAQVQAQNAKYALEDQRQQIALQVRQAYLDYRNAVQQLEAADKRLRAAEQARAAAQERYNLGSASIVELQNTTRDYVDAASQMVRARYTLIFRKKQIDYHVGRLSPSVSMFNPQNGL